MNRLFIRRFSVDTAQIPAGSYLAGLPAVRGGGLTFTAPVTFFVGEIHADRGARRGIRPQS